MKKPKTHFVLAAALVLMSAVALAQTAEPVYYEFPGPGDACRIGEDYTFVYEFAKPPKMGLAILRLQLFDRAGKRATELDITGQLGMPSMPGAHDSGEKAFKLNKKGDYLLPLNIVMPGLWEVRLVFSRDKDVIYRGRLNFNV